MAQAVHRFVVLLRGVNVGKGNRLPMADFRSTLAALGFADIRTLLASGNAVVAGTSPGPAVHARAIQAALAGDLGLNVVVIVKSRDELDAIVAENPFSHVVPDPSRLLVAFAQEPKALEGLSAIAPLVQPGEQFAIGPQAAYFQCPRGVIESKLGAALLGKAGPLVTTRNWGTVLKIHQMLGENALQV